MKGFHGKGFHVRFSVSRVPSERGAVHGVRQRAHAGLGHRDVLLRQEPRAAPACRHRIRCDPISLLLSVFFYFFRCRGLLRRRLPAGWSEPGRRGLHVGLPGGAELCAERADSMRRLRRRPRVARQLCAQPVHAATHVLALTLFMLLSFPRERKVPRLCETIHHRPRGGRGGARAGQAVRCAAPRSCSDMY